MQNFSEYANTLRRKMKFSKEKTIFVCIGSNKVVWDSIGPYVGSILKEKIGEKYVIGDLENNICSQKDLKSYYPKDTDAKVIYFERFGNYRKQFKWRNFCYRKTNCYGNGCISK